MYVSACALYALRSTAATAPLFVLAATKADPTVVFAEEREEVEGKREGAVANMRIEWRDFEHEPVYFESGTWKQAKRVRLFRGPPVLASIVASIVGFSLYHDK